ncbi:CinA family protein [Cellulomonas sp. HZM]|uniref:CinA family protein n=1 Tax=Cellulomonas sp. HZM TaxID=1454010 RepID=UPI0004936D43|nr:nicotinamide-nucleotide amidohydrolase family protein [Cellulomonas sp. HZM]
MRGEAPDTAAERAHVLLDALRVRGLTLAVAESLTGGLVTARLVDVPGASTVLRGGVVAYATDLKATVLAVDRDLLDRHGPVHPEVAAQMARGVAVVLGADVGLATTGVAGPGPADGHDAGTVHVAVHVTARAGDPTTDAHRGLVVVGTRDDVRAAATDAVLQLALDVVGTREA